MIRTADTVPRDLGERHSRNVSSFDSMERVYDIQQEVGR